MTQDPKDSPEPQLPQAGSEFRAQPPDPQQPPAGLPPEPRPAAPGAPFDPQTPAHGGTYPRQQAVPTHPASSGGVPFPPQYPTEQFTGQSAVPPEYMAWAPRETPTQPTTPMPPYPHAFGGGQQPPTGSFQTMPGAPYAPGPNNTGAFAAAPYATTTTAAPPRRGRAGLVAGTIVLALVAGGVGGAVGALVANSDSSSSGSALDGPIPNAKPASVTAPAGSVQAVAQKVLPSVVMIKVVGDKTEGEGSGVVLSSDGLILTNNHVASGAGANAKMQVQFKDGTTTSASVVGVDPVSDIAVIKAANKSGLTPIDMGTSRDLQVGQPVVAVGSPLGLAGTVTTGIVSALNRPVSTSGESGGTGTVISAVQTDAPINPGNSGGALVDMNGKLIGINTAIATLGGSDSGGQQSGSIGLGFAIPVDQARRVADQLIKTGHATYAQIGMSVLNQAPGNVGTSGAVVKDVTADGPAAKAGIPAGVVVTKLDDQVIDNGDALVAAVRSHQPGDKVSVTYTDTSGQNPKTVQVTLAGAPADGGR